MRKSKPAVGIFFILFACGALLYEALYRPNDIPNGKISIIPPQSPASVVADSLVRQGVIRSKLAFMLALKLLGEENQLHPGIYEFRNGETNSEIISDLTHVRSARHTFVTFPEGITSYEAGRVVQKELGVDSARFVALVHDSDLAHALGIDAQSLEGRLFPETYEFDRPVQATAVITRMVFASEHFFTDSLLHRCRALGMSAEQILTLASLVEGEAAQERERARIAGVYWNRLRAGMKLEADPTIQYILGEPRRLTYNDLRIVSPYNTYLYPGLPPTPVNNPGRASILAALYPENNSYLYFVARGDGSRLHTFSRTLDEHTKAVARYRRERDRREKSESR